MWQDLAPWLAQGGIIGAILWAAIALVRIALGAERRRADDWREAAKTSASAAAVMSGHVERLVSAVEQLTAAQRECLSILQGLAAAERRSAA